MLDKVNASCELASTCARQSSSWRAASALFGLALAPSNNGQLLIIVELPSVPHTTWNFTLCRYSTSPHRSFIDVSHAQQWSAAGQENLLKSCLTWSAAGSAKSWIPKEAVAWVGIPVVTTVETHFCIANGSTRPSGCQRLNSTERRDSSLMSSNEQEHLWRTVSFSLGPIWTLTRLGESQWTVSLSCSFPCDWVAMETHTVFSITGPFVLLTKGATFATANTCFRIRYDPNLIPPWTTAFLSKGTMRVNDCETWPTD